MAWVGWQMTVQTPSGEGAVVGVVAATADAEAEARGIAAAHGFVWSGVIGRDVELDRRRPIAGVDVALVVRPDGLEALNQRTPGVGPVRVDLGSPDLAHRRATAGARPPIRRAMAALGSARPSVLDATGALLRDAALFASWGCAVVAVELVPAIYVLAADGLRRAAADPALAALAAQMRLVHGDAVDVLRGLSEPDRPDVIYLDPMYPEARRKAALPSKELQLVRALAGEDDTGAELLAVARQTARDRVVVKRPLRAPPLGAAPTATFEGETTRFDMYLSAKAP